MYPCVYIRDLETCFCAPQLSHQSNSLASANRVAPSPPSDATAHARSRRVLSSQRSCCRNTTAGGWVRTARDAAARKRKDKTQDRRPKQPKIRGVLVMFCARSPPRTSSPNRTRLWWCAVPRQSNPAPPNNEAVRVASTRRDTKCSDSVTAMAIVSKTCLLKIVPTNTKAPIIVGEPERNRDLEFPGMFSF